MGEPADTVTEAAKAAVEKTTTRIDAFIAERRKLALENDRREEAQIQRFQEERAEAVRLRNDALRARFAAMGLSSADVEAFLASLPENIP